MDPADREFGAALRRARALISSEEHWIARGYAADARGHWTPVGSPEAARFTVLGAVMRAGRGSKDILASAQALFREVAPELCAKLRSTVEPMTHAESLALMDAAIAAVPHDRPYVPKQSGFVQRLSAEPNPAESLTSLFDAVRRQRPGG